MFARLNHVAMQTDYYAVNGKFYEALFKMRLSSKPRPSRAVVLGDGYTGLNIIPRREGRRSGLDHFGIEVQDIALARERMQKFSSRLEVLRRPTDRPFAAYSAHDPDGNVFDLSQRDIGFQKDVYAENDWEQARRITHIGMRTLNPESCARFYAEVFELKLLNDPGTNAYSLTDGKVTLRITPWRIGAYAGMDCAAPGMDHIGFTVESVEGVKQDLETLLGDNPLMGTRPLGHGPEGKARLALFQTCPIGKFHLTDLEGVLIDVSEDDGLQH